ncbi:MAG: hypothetical protein HY551_01025 [Elusimicrobia bacterium]|nr:hypothetical protein [Elusimicrobiota bacterium]
MSYRVEGPDTRARPAERKRSIRQNALQRAASCAGLLAALLSGAAHASNEDIGSAAAAVAMGESWTAVSEGVASIAYNPAAIGSVASAEFQGGSRRAFQLPAGPADIDHLSVAAAVPLDSLDIPGALGFSWANTSRGNFSLDHTVGVTAASRGWKEFDAGLLDAGATLKAITRSGRATGGQMTKAAVDLGLLFRTKGGQALGASVFNVNGPRMDLRGVQDRAPVIGRVGYAQSFRAFTIALDFVKREPSLGLSASQTLGAGMQYWWHTARGGSWAGRSGLNLSDRSKSWAWGIGWRMLGGQLDYALQAPLSNGSRWSHAVSLAFRFGSWNPEREYEKLLERELRYRQEISRALDSSQSRQAKLTEELKGLQAEMKSLRAELERRSSSESEARKRLQGFEERHRRAQKSLEELAREKRAIEQRSKESLFREDWGKYQKLKQDGAPDVVLLERIQQILREYKGAEIDLSDANQELMRLLRNRPAP